MEIAVTDDHNLLNRQEVRMKTQITMTTDQLRQILKNTGLGKEEFLRRMTRVKADNYMNRKSKVKP